MFSSTDGDREGLKRARQRRKEGERQRKKKRKTGMEGKRAKLVTTSPAAIERKTGRQAHHPPEDLFMWYGRFQRGTSLEHALNPPPSERVSPPLNFVRTSIN